MKILVEIPEAQYITLNAKTQEEVVAVLDYTLLVNAIKNGTPLPKGHGRLIDADALEKRMLDREVELNDDKSLWESSAVSVALDMFAPTIIEKDKE